MTKKKMKFVTIHQFRAIKIAWSKFKSKLRDQHHVYKEFIVSDVPNLI